jgi:hypothetical protein
MKSFQASYAGRVALLIALFWLSLAVMAAHAGGTVTNGYITAVLRSECANSPTPPPPVGSTVVGSNYVIMTVADASPTNFAQAQQLVTDAVFESLMPQYCNLAKTTNNCVTDSVQWNIITYDTNGQPMISGCAVSGCQSHSCAGSESGPPLILDQPSNQSVNSGQSATFSVDASGTAPLSYQWLFDGTNVLAGATNSTLVLPNAQTNQAGSYLVLVYNALGNTNSQPASLTVNPGPAATNGYITAVLRSECADSPTPPPPVGGTTIGSDYVIMTVADASPTNFALAQQVVTDAIFQTLMPLYCNLPRNSKNCVTDSVQWNIITYDANGQPLISGCAASGCQLHSCGDFESGSPVILVQPTNQFVNAGQSATFSVNASGAAPLYYQWLFDSTHMLAGATNSTLVLLNAQTNQAGSYQVLVYNAVSSTNSRPAILTVNPGPAVTNGYLTAVLRGEYANAPTPPPPVGCAAVGSNYIIMTVADGNPSDFQQAQAVVTDAIFASLMPLYCALPETTNNCVTPSVQWNIITYDAHGHPVISGCAASGCQSHECSGGGTQTLPPMLTLSPGTNGPGLSWSTLAADFVVEESTNMLDWYQVTWPTATNFDTISAQMSGEGGVHYFRLRQN